MTYRANPSEVAALRIVEVGPVRMPVLYSDDQCGPLGVQHLTLENGDTVRATPDMRDRFIPIQGDYWVVQADGHAFISPKAVFERRYTAVKEPRVMPTFQKATCRGCYALNSACGHCERCAWEREGMQ